MPKSPKSVQTAPAVKPTTTAKRVTQYELLNALPPEAVQPFAEAIDELDEADRESVGANCLALASRMARMSGGHLDFVAAAIEALENDRGTFTPAEDFINSALLLYGLQRKDGTSAFTPAALQEKVDEFRENFEDMQRVARRFVERHQPKVEEAGG